MNTGAEEFNNTPMRVDESPNEIRRKQIIHNCFNEIDRYEGLGSQKKYRK
jgi:hypothetical protein